jgi:hypothetical protein
MNPLQSTERVILALKGTPMLLTLLLINLAVLAMLTYLTVAAATMRSAERADLVSALRACIQRCEPAERRQ